MRRGRINTWKQNGQKVSKVDKVHHPNKATSLTITKQNKYIENYTGYCTSHTVENKDKPQSSQRIKTHYIQGNNEKNAMKQFHLYKGAWKTEE